MPAVIAKEKCVGCEDCLDACPADAIKMENGIAVIDPDFCLDCAGCVDECANEAIEMD